MSEIPFKKLVEVFNNVKKERDHSNKITIIRSFITNYCTNNLTLFYPVLRLFLPKLDKERGAYGLQQRKIAEILVHILKISKNTNDYNTLLNYKSHLDSSLNDFADVAAILLRTRFLKSSHLKVSEVNEYLDNISNYKDNIREKTDEITRLFMNTDNEEQKWILRLLLKDLRLGIGYEKILSLYHNDAAKVFYYKGSLIKTCQILHSPDIHLGDVEIELFSPFYPMLAEKCDIEVINNVVNNSEFFLEKKFDGERFQIHMQDGVFAYFSRKGFDFTHTFGKNYNEGLYTPTLKGVFQDSVRNVLLDGEMMGFNKMKQEFGSKGMHFDVKHLTSDSVHQPCFVAFDILLLNDDVLTRKPLSERLVILKSILKPQWGVFMLSESEKFHTKQQLLDCLNKAVDDNEEGVVFKKPDSLYKPNSRREGWWKLKLEYFENVMSDIDVIIMGGYYGEGNAAKRIVAFLVGIADVHDQGAFPNAYLSFCKIKSGLSNEEIDYIHNKIGNYWKSSGTPICHDLKFGNEKPDLWIPPGNSILLVVRGTELVKVSGKDYATPYTMRFPRILRINDTKPYYDCFTIKDLLNLTKSAECVIKLTSRHLTLNDLKYTKKAKREKGFVPIEYSNLQQVTNILQGYEFCVWTGIEKYGKTDIEKLIVENGGQIAQVDRQQTYCILVGDYTSKLESLKDVSKDIVNVSWIFRIIDKGDFESYEKNEVIFTSTETRLRFMSEYDKYGDSYTKFSTEQNLRDIINEIKKDCIVPSQMEIDDLKSEMFNQE